MYFKEGNQGFVAGILNPSLVAIVSGHALVEPQLVPKGHPVQGEWSEYALPWIGRHFGTRMGRPKKQRSNIKKRTAVRHAQDNSFFASFRKLPFLKFYNLGWT